MRLINVFLKCMREQKRDLWVLGLSLAFAPVFVLAYFAFLGGNSSTSYRVLVINQDTGVTQKDNEHFYASEDIIQQLQNMKYKDGSPILRVQTIENRSEAEMKLRNRYAALLLIIPTNFSKVANAVVQGEKPPPTQVEFIGDLTNPYYTIAAVMVMTIFDNYNLTLSDNYRPIQLLETPLGASAARSEFDNYVPGLLVLSVILMIFQAAMMVTREVEDGKIKRLRITHITALDLLGGITAWLMIIAILEILLTFATAVICGFHSQGSIWIAILVGIITSFSIIGTGMIVASFSKTVSQAFVIANFPLGFFMLLSGAIFPMSKTTLFTIGSHDIGLFDFMPPSHAVTALNKVLTMGAKLSDVSFELTALICLSLLYFSIGIILFRQMRLK